MVRARRMLPASVGGEVRTAIGEVAGVRLRRFTGPRCVKSHTSNLCISVRRGASPPRTKIRNSQSSNLAVPAAASSADVLQSAGWDCKPLSNKAFISAHIISPESCIRRPLTIRLPSRQGRRRRERLGFSTEPVDNSVHHRRRAVRSRRNTRPVFVL